ncbi:hypothetical protein OIM90_27945 [Streptomyces sp. AD16]|nr:hypothetical protein OIM90_27945 [Streptomyces sp. AD16]
MTHIITPACAEHEEQAARDTTTARWQATGDFLSAAITGMLQAPVTQTRQPLADQQPRTQLANPSPSGLEANQRARLTESPSPPPRPRRPAPHQNRPLQRAPGIPAQQQSPTPPSR